MKTIILPFFLLITFHCCSQAVKVEDDYPEHVGDTSFAKDVDDPNFKVCNENRILQYYNFGKGLQYRGEKPAISQHFNSRFLPKEQIGENGFLTIRFIVNCEGKTGWFRVEGMDKNYKKKTFNKALTNELLMLTKALDGWIVGGDEHNKFDYYQYLTFKIENGKLTEIMP